MDVLDARSGKSISKLFFLCFILYLSALDIVGFDVGNATIKLQLLLFPLILLFVLIKQQMKIRIDGLWVVVFFIFCLVPSLIFSLNPLTSVGFLLGTVSCVSVLLVTANLARRIPLDVIYTTLIYSYRGTVVSTFVFVVLGLQVRGHFLLYESSYWAIFLIPYISIVAYRFFCDKLRFSKVDIFAIFVGIVISQSASLVIWTLLIVFIFMFSLGKVKIIHIFSLCSFIAIFSFFLVLFNARASHLYYELMAADDVSSLMGVLIFLAGNRVQRLLVPIEVGSEHPFFGVGGGMLRNVAASMSVDDFTIYGQSAYDFELNSSAPGVNVILEVFAEHGLLGVVSFLILLIYVYRRTLCSPKLLPLRIAFVVTIISLLIESNYMRYYLWVLMGVILGLSRIPTVRCGYKNDNI